MRQHLALVIRGSASVKIAVPSGRLERGRLPEIQWVRWLNVIMAIYQDGRCPLHRGRFGKNQRMAGRFNDFGGQAEFSETLGHPIGGASIVLPAGRIRADAWDPQQVAKSVFKPGTMGVKIGINGVHGLRSPWPDRQGEHLLCGYENIL
jgi:hypothetical protein